MLRLVIGRGTTPAVRLMNSREARRGLIEELWANQGWEMLRAEPRRKCRHGEVWGDSSQSDRYNQASDWRWEVREGETQDEPRASSL